MPFKTDIHKIERLLDYIHADVWVPIRITSQGGHIYFVNFINDYSQKFSVYFMHHKSKTFIKFKLLKAEVKN